MHAWRRWREELEGPGRARDLLLQTPSARATEYVSLLSPKARVVVEPYGSEIEKAFAVKGYPGFALVGADGVVTVSGDLAEVAAAAARVAV